MKKTRKQKYEAEVKKIDQFEKYLQKKLAGLTIKDSIMNYFYSTFAEEYKNKKLCKKWKEVVNDKLEELVKK
jgi:hypothetical protein